MHLRRDERIVCGLDVGTWKTCAVALRLDPDGTPAIVGSGHADSRGLVKGVIVNLDEAGASIRRAIEDLEANSGICLDWVMAGISGVHIGSHSCRAAASVEGKYHEVRWYDDEAHGWQRRENQRDAAERILAFLRRHLLEEPPKS